MQLFKGAGLYPCPSKRADLPGEGHDLSAAEAATGVVMNQQGWVPGLLPGLEDVDRLNPTSRHFHSKEEFSVAKFKLKDDDEAAVPYSKAERAVFGAIPRTRFETTSVVLDKMYGEAQPYHGRNMFNSLVRNLIRKMNLNNEPIEIKRTPRRGPHPILLRLVKKS